MLTSRFVPPLRFGSRLKSGLGLWALLFGLLCVTGQSFVETTHAHVADDSSVFCQLCSGAADTGVTPRAHHDFDQGSAIFAAQPIHADAALGVFIPFKPRGPPATS